MLTVGSLFAGIGGIELGLEWTNGFKTVWQVENDPYAQKVLAKHWPDVGRWDDVRNFPPAPAEDWRCDLICGGFPCQDISDAGKRAGIDGERSGLWREFARIVRTLRPRFALVENTSAILYRGLGRVLGDLAACGYDAEWSLVSACSMGAPHARKRLFCLAYPSEQRRTSKGIIEMANACKTLGETSAWESGRTIRKRTQWAIEPELAGMVDGIPSRLDRVACLGNAVVPQVAQWIGERILEAITPRRDYLT